MKILDIKSFFNNKTILVTGGTGTIGSEIVSQLLKLNPKLIRIFSNSENEIWETKLKFVDTMDKTMHLGSTDKVEFILGDIRNYNSVKKVMHGIDFVFNAAAIKHVAISEYDPLEAINVNIFGLENLIRAAKEESVSKFIHISTDKAVLPTTVMGATKMLSERICLANFRRLDNYNLTISCVRFGNVLGSRGSVIPLIKDLIKNKNIATITDRRMRRFFMSVSQAVELVLRSMVISEGGETFVLKMPTLKIIDLIEVLIEEYSKKIGIDKDSVKLLTIGAGSGEKLNEQLIASAEYESCYEKDEMYIIKSINWDYSSDFVDKSDKIAEKFHYSTKLEKVLSKDQIKKLLYDLNLI